MDLGRQLLSPKIFEKIKTVYYTEENKSTSLDYKKMNEVTRRTCLLLKFMTAVLLKGNHIGFILSRHSNDRQLLFFLNGETTFPFNDVRNFQPTSV